MILLTHSNLQWSVAYLQCWTDMGESSGNYVGAHVIHTPRLPRGDANRCFRSQSFSANSHRRKCPCHIDRIGADGCQARTGGVDSRCTPPYIQIACRVNRQTAGRTMRFSDMTNYKKCWLVCMMGLFAVLSVRTGHTATSLSDGLPIQKGTPTTLATANADATEHAQQTSTYLRCYYRTSHSPFRLDTHYVWATDPTTNWFYRLSGQWHGGEAYHWQRLFYTDQSQAALDSLCQDTLRSHGIDTGLAMYSAGNRAFAFDYSTWKPDANSGGTSIDRVVAFGDSLSDTHNMYNASRWQIPNGTSWFAGRFTNGHNWVEDLAGDLQVPLYDWAVGGVGVSDRQVLPWAKVPGLLSQSRQWRRATGEDPSYDPGRTLFTVLIGGNDLIFFGTSPREIVGKEVQALQVLIAGGAKNILVLNLPDISRAPIFKLKPGEDDVASKVRVVNAELDSAIAAMRTEYGARVNIQLFDANALFNRLFQNPAAYGFQNATDSCLDINRTGFSNFMESHMPRPECKNPDTFVFWDMLHPTARTHRMLADDVAAFVATHFPVAFSHRAS
ncbi:SGNH/GDSL hydrolase family protein [Paraburkholderia fungorum]|uniref:SGNH/GDSL hydrolase family protein n=1 Tax=Paraburkholderia fungorum TaxID=134537 RepID=UPI0038BE0979